LYYCGETLGRKVSGYVIEKQFELTDYFLLLINWDCPLEEGCEIVIVSKNQNIIDSYSFTPIYNSYNLKSFTELSKNHYKITFNESDCFEVVIDYPKKYLLSKVVNVNQIANTEESTREVARDVSAS